MKKEKEKRYRLSNLLMDILLTWITGGLWLIVLLIKFLREN